MRSSSNEKYLKYQGREKDADWDYNTTAKIPAIGKNDCPDERSHKDNNVTMKRQKKNTPHKTACRLPYYFHVKSVRGEIPHLC